MPRHAQYVPLTEKTCLICNQTKPINEFNSKKGKNRPYYLSYCRKCYNEKYQEKFSKKLDDDFNLIPKNPNQYDDEEDKELTKEFLLKIGWKFDEVEQVFYKPGLKELDGTWNFNFRKRNPINKTIFDKKPKEPLIKTDDDKKRKEAETILESNCLIKKDKRNTGKLPKLMVDMIYKMVDDGWAIMDVSILMRISRTTISNYIRKRKNEI